jgi:hypothetical protein
MGGASAADEAVGRGFFISCRFTSFAANGRMLGGKTGRSFITDNLTPYLLSAVFVPPLRRASNMNPRKAKAVERPPTNPPPKYVQENIFFPARASSVPPKTTPTSPIAMRKPRVRAEYDSANPLAHVHRRAMVSCPSYWRRSSPRPVIDAAPRLLTMRRYEAETY